MKTVSAFIRFIFVISFSVILICGCAGSKDPKNKWQELSKKTTTLFQQGRYNESIEVGKKALQLAENEFGVTDPEKVAISLFNLAGNYYVQEKYEAALPLFNKALSIIISLNGKNELLVAEILKSMASIDYKQNKFSEARDKYQTAVLLYAKNYGNTHPAVPAIFVNLAEIYRIQCKLDDAIRFYQAALKLQPDNKTIKENMGKIIADKKDIDSIKMTLQEQVLLKPGNYELEWRLGNLYRLSDDNTEALKRYNKALSIKADYFDALLDSAALYFKTAEYQKSVDAYTKVYKQKPERADVIFALAKAYSKLNDTENALRLLEKLVKMGSVNKEWLERDKDLENVRATSEYQGLLKQLKG